MIMEIRLFLLYLFSSVPHIFVLGIPVSSVVNDSISEEDGVGGKPSFLLEASQKVPFSLLHPSQLMNSSAGCEAFTNGTSPLEFSSPNYPNFYPDNIDCIKIIEAPEDHVVLVQFHDFFHIEAPVDGSGTSCPYDYLEIRNGKFGYSPFQATTCGKQPPTLTKSKGKYLWLRFHSDATVTYKGFRAVIQFLPDPSPKPDFDTCIFEIGGIAGDIVSKNAIPLDYLQHAQSNKDKVDCTWVVQALPGREIFLRIPVYRLEQPNDCNHNAIEIYTSYAKLAGRTIDPPIRLCGSLQKATITSEDHVLAIRLTTKVGPKSLIDDMKKLSHFEANYTIIRPVQTNVSQPNGKACGDDEFDCSDQTCIHIDLKCDGKVNCQLKNDEDTCPDLKPEGLKADIFIIAFLGALLVVGMCTGMFLNIFRKLKQDREEIQALRGIQRKSRESGLQMTSEAQSQKSVCPSENHAELSAGPRQIPFEEQSSTESKDTVIHKPSFESTNRIQSLQQLPTTGTSSLPVYEQAVLNPGSTGPPTLQLNNPRKVVGRRASDIPTTLPKGNLQVALYRKPSEPIPESSSLSLVPMQFVRDCACQTRESYLMARLHGQHGPPGMMTRAPLARGEAIEFFQGTPIRRLSRPPQPFFFPPSSASSEIGNSLERLDEEFE